MRALLSRFPLILIFLCVSSHSTLLSTEENPRNILVLHSYHQGLEWSDTITNGIKDVFENENKNYTLLIDYLDTKRNSSPAYLDGLKEYYAKKSRKIEYSAIILVDNNAFQLYLENQGFFSPDVPVFFCGVNDFEPTQIEGMTNITGIREYNDHESNIRLMRRLHPNAKRIVIINENTVTGLAVESQLKKMIPKFEGDIEFIFPDHISSENLSHDLEFLQENDLIYLLTFARDSHGRFISYRYGCYLLRESTNAPIYGSWEFYLGKGIVGGNMISGFDQGSQVARMALKVLKGEKISNVPVIMNPPSRYQFDYNELERFSISSKQLPAGSIIINKPPFLTTRQLIWAGSLMLLLTVLLLFFFIQNKVSRYQAHRVMLENKRLDELVLERTKSLEREIEDRKQIESELLDSNQTKDKFLSIIAHDLKSPAQSILQLSEILMSDVDTMSPEEVKSVCNELRNQSIASYSLLEDLLTWAAIKQNKIEAKLQLLRLDDTIHESIQIHKNSLKQKRIHLSVCSEEQLTLESDRFMLLTICNNLLSNAIKFTPENGEIKISARRDENQVILEIEDRGIGMDESVQATLFDMNHPSRRGTNDERGTGLGLSIIQEFVSNLGGKISAHSDGEGCGSKFIVEFVTNPTHEHH